MKTRWTALGLGGLIAIGASWAAYRVATDADAGRTVAVQPPASSARTHGANALPARTALARAAAAATTQAAFSFQAPTIFASSKNTFGVGIGDVTGDGRADLVTLPERPMIYVQQADGSLSSAQPGPNYPDAAFTMLLADINGDGISDILTGRTGGMQMWLADGAGGFRPTSYFDRALSHLQLRPDAVADVDGDGAADFFVETESGGLFFLNDGSGGFRQAPFRFYAQGSELKAGDFDGDGRIEVVAASGREPNGFLTYTSEGQDIQRGADVVLTDAGYSARAIAVGDFDDDGRNDYAVAAVDANKAMKLRIFSPDDQGRPQPTPVALDGHDEPIVTLAVDLDRDGRTDLVVVHRDGLGYYLQGDDGLQAEQFVALPLNADPRKRYVPIAAGDLNGDGCTDLAVAAGASGAIVLYGQNCTPAPVPTQKIAHDVDQDGKSDLLWRYPAGGHWGYWLMDGAQRRSASDYPLDPALQSLAVGRYAAEDRLDVLWRDRDWIWSSRVRAGNGSVSLFLQRPYPDGYRLVASGDIDGDGVDDLLWRDNANTVVAAWAMSHVEVRAGKAYHLPPSWRIAGSGDFDGDGRLDLIWTDGRKMKLWSGRKNLSFAESAMSGYPVGWELAGTGDVDGDGRADLFWRRADLNAFVVWYMDGGRRTGGDSYTVDASWRVLDSGDFDGDGKTDLVWTNGTLMQLWQSKGRSFLGLPMADYPQHWVAIKN
ncbi:FG-GAP repeat domain-containing protein [Lysobacter enzymogenes]|uniref:VCBS repeat-containing protein n=2 Tax=Bacteria TaxID=2 RepID=A0AAU9AL57_LYSEN|nr:VCBS repeat-containing protein [Lysobacter enzymogenes]BAV95971.1 hypothetical protein LEN_0484 [Lysobacter enzymogenes]